MRSGWSSGSICWVLLVSGRFAVSKAIIPDGQEHFLTPSAHRDTHIFGGLGLKRRILSEIALEDYQRFFVLKHKWNDLTADEQESIGRIVKEVNARYGGKTRWLRNNHWMLRGNPDVPNLFA